MGKIYFMQRVKLFYFVERNEVLPSFTKTAFSPEQNLSKTQVPTVPMSLLVNNHLSPESNIIINEQ